MECELLVAQAIPRLHRATVSSDDGSRPLHPGRTGDVAFVPDIAGVRHISERIAEAIGVPLTRFESFQVVRYGLGEQYEPHLDTFPPGTPWLRPGGQRVGSFLMYLRSPDRGGDTIFPQWGIHIPARAGDAIYFPSDWWHGSEPVLAGEKWSATKWV